MCGRDVDRYSVAWGDCHDSDELDKHLIGGVYSAITVVHSETSTGALNDIRTLSEVARNHGVRCLVDSVSGLAGARVEMDAWELDYVLTGSQKAFALPPGLAFSVASGDFIEATKKVEDRGVYFDLVEMDHFALRGQVPSTPALSLLYALDVQLDAMAREGIEARWQRHAEMSALTNTWTLECQQDGIRIQNIVEKERRSPTVSTIQLPEGITSDDFLRKVASNGITIATGYGKLKSTTFRIGHMGDHTPATLQRCIDACRRALVPRRSK